MTREEIRRRLIAAGWKIAHPSSRYLLVGRSGDLSIYAYDFLTRTADASFELIDSKWTLLYWVRTIPSPRIASVLLEEYGEPLPVGRRSA